MQLNAQHFRLEAAFSDHLSSQRCYAISDVPDPSRLGNHENVSFRIPDRVHHFFTICNFFTIHNFITIYHFFTIYQSMYGSAKNSSSLVTVNHQTSIRVSYAISQNLALFVISNSTPSALRVNYDFGSNRSHCLTSPRCSSENNCPFAVKGSHSESSSGIEHSSLPISTELDS